MAVTGAPLVIALEEHYYDAELAATFDGPEGRASETRRRLFDLGELRLAEMDAAGIDVQVLSHGAPSVQRLDPETSVWMARGANDRLAEAIAAHPDRFAGFAALPTPDPEAAAAELDRAVTTLGFKGAMVHGLTNGVFLDDRRFWPIFERAQALDVPLYIHPAVPERAVVEAYYRDYLAEFPSLLTAAWGFTVETATQAIRLVLSGAFEAYPGLKVILGHMGEGLPFVLWRLDSRWGFHNHHGIELARGNPAEYLRHNLYITTSGVCDGPPLLCSILALGADHVLFGTDYPFEDMATATRFLEVAPISPADRAKIAHQNAERLLRL